MSKATCKSCPHLYKLAFDQTGEGECRRNPPVAKLDDDGDWCGVWPIILSLDDFCGEHPKRKGGCACSQ